MRVLGKRRKKAGLITPMATAWRKSAKQRTGGCRTSRAIYLNKAPRGAHKLSNPNNEHAAICQVEFIPLNI